MDGYKTALLRSLSRRSEILRSEDLPLTTFDPVADEDVDISNDGKYFVVLEDPGGTVKDIIFGAIQTEEVTTEIQKQGRDITTTETARRTFRVWPTIEEAVKHGVVVDACFPVVQAGDVIQGRKWSEDAQDNLEFLNDRKTPYKLLVWLAGEIMKFLQESEEVVEEAGEVPEPSEE